MKFPFCLAYPASSLLLLSMVVFPSPATADEGDALRALYMGYLTEEGFRPEIDQDGDVMFKYESKTYFIDVHEKDPEFFMIVLPNIWPIESEEERIEVLAAADYANSQAKSAKVYTKSDDVWVSLEMFVERPEDFKAVFKRALAAITEATSEFVGKMRE